MKRSAGHHVRTAFLAGILVLTPFAITVWVVVYLVTFLESAVNLLPDGLQPEKVLGFPIPGLGIAMALGTILVVGFAARSYVGGRLVQLSERLLDRVPVVSGLYSGVKQLMEALFGGERGQFRKVVLVEWPRRGMRAIAFHTGDAFIQPSTGARMVNIFLPSTPNPTTGFYLVVDEAEVEELDLSVEGAFKLIMSAGMVAPSTPMVLTKSGVEWETAPTPTPTEPR